MDRNARGPNWLARGLMLLSAILLFAAPALPSAAMPQGHCCAEMPCHDQSQKAACPEACVIACQVVVAPEPLIVRAAAIGSAPVAPMISLFHLGRVLAPELPPPR